MRRASRGALSRSRGRGEQGDTVTPRHLAWSYALGCVDGEFSIAT
jgi:hypothetical protein